MLFLDESKYRQFKCLTSCMSWCQMAVFWTCFFEFQFILFFCFFESLNIFQCVCIIMLLSVLLLTLLFTTLSIVSQRNYFSQIPKIDVV